jgi:hypothetical protein
VSTPILPDSEPPTTNSTLRLRDRRLKKKRFGEGTMFSIFINENPGRTILLGHAMGNALANHSGLVKINTTGKK